jgi:hypothetical protein
VAFAAATFAKLYVATVHSLGAWRLPWDTAQGTALSLDRLSQAGGWAVIPWGGLLWLWLIWLLSAMSRTSHLLQELPYLSTRFRQLSFRFFVLQSLLVSLFLVGCFAASVLYDPTVFTTAALHYNAFPPALLFTVYLILLAAIYLPVHAAPHRPRALARLLTNLPLPAALRKGGPAAPRSAPVLNYEVHEDAGAPAMVFCLETALLAAHLSWQVRARPAACRRAAGPSAFAAFPARRAAPVEKRLGLAVREVSQSPGPTRKRLRTAGPLRRHTRTWWSRQRRRRTRRRPARARARRRRRARQQRRYGWTGGAGRRRRAARGRWAHGGCWCGTRRRGCARW